MAGTGAGQRGVTRAATWKKKVEEIRQTARFGGFPIPDDVHPVDVLLDELKRSTAFCWWIESKISEWPDDLIPLGDANYDDKGGRQVDPTEEAAWLAVWQKEREHRAKVAKMCLDAGVADRQIALAEQQSNLMFALINDAFGMLQLSPEQERIIPQVMPALIRRMVLPGVADHAE